jgi:RNA polymerase sigma-70 factor (ECF subfamily)
VAPLPSRPEVDWKVTVQQIRDGDPAGEELLYSRLAAGARLFLRRKLRIEDVEDRVHDLFVTVVGAIRRGELREPERLMGFVRTILNRQLSLEIARLVQNRRTSVDVALAGDLKAHEANPEEEAAAHQKVELMKDALRGMSERDFEILTRFYLHEQPAEQIRKEMGLTQTQFDLLKARAKGRLMQSVQRKLTRRRFNRE